MVTVYYETAIAVVYRFQINVLLKERRVHSRVLSNRFAKYYYCKMKGTYWCKDLSPTIRIPNFPLLNLYSNEFFSCTFLMVVNVSIVFSICLSQVLN